VIVVFSFPVMAEMEDETDLTHSADMESQSAGCLVMDCGATDSVGSILALEKLVALLDARPSGRPPIEVDPKNITRFRFGNGQRDTSISRVQLPFIAGGKAGHIGLAVLDTNDQYVPLLGGMNFLSKSGAVIDFGSERAVFKAIDATKIVNLKKCANGLLALDLTKDDLLSNASPSK